MVVKKRIKIKNPRYQNSKRTTAYSVGGYYGENILWVFTSQIKRDRTFLQARKNEISAASSLRVFWSTK